MVMIITAEDDFTSNDVIDWLRYYKVDFIRVSTHDLIKYLSVKIDQDEFDIIFLINEILFKVSDFSAFWYRRSHFNIFVNKISVDNNISSEINKHLYIETNEIHKLFLKYIQKKSINNYNDIYLNKLEVLNKANEVGIKIPQTIVCSCKEDVFEFKKKNINIITKNFSQGVFIFDNNMMFSSTTKLVTEDVFNLLPDFFSYSMFQESIDKIFELRVFYLVDKFYASAIFSQNDPKTQIDFRNYNHEKPNRTPPFILPNEIENKLLKLMKMINLNSGSIDLLVTENNEYIFLEVNPIGQFAQVSIPCNYYLEEKVAKKIFNLCKYGN